jgi:hypothetical protein
VSKQPRVRLVQLVRAEFVTETSRGDGRVQDLSSDGFFVRSPLLPPDGVRVAVVLVSPSGRKIAVEGTVRWNTASLTDRGERSGFGVRLTRFGDDYLHFADGAQAAGSPL